VATAAAARASEERGRDRLRGGERRDLVARELADRARSAPSCCTAAIPEKDWITLS
jgi:hypothetical protein